MRTSDQRGWWRMRPASTGRALLAVLLALALATPSVRADDRGAAAEAKAAYQEGTAAYERGRFEEAIAAFGRAYDLDPAPMLLFNLAQSYWKAGQNDRALVTYRRYLDADPVTPNRPRVEARISELEAALRPPHAEPVSQPAPPPAPSSPVTPPPTAIVAAQAPPPPAPPLHRRPWFWMVVGGLAVATGTALLVAHQAGSRPYVCAQCDRTLPVPNSIP
jgi:tetratricopeptide (TPR) repeat protein